MSENRKAAGERLGLRTRLRYLLLRWTARTPWSVIWLVAWVISSRYVRWLIPGRIAPVIDKSRQWLAVQVSQNGLDCPTARRILGRCCLNRLLQPCLVARSQRIACGMAAPRVHVTGLEALREQVESGHRVLLLGSHFGVGRFFPGWLSALTGWPIMSLEAVDELARMGVQGLSLKVVELNSRFRAQVTLAALKHLHSGGILHMTGDNQNEQLAQSAMIAVGDTVRSFPLGPPYLVQQTGAMVFPYFCRLLDSGHVQVEICEPLRGTGTYAVDRKGGAEQWLEMYAGLLAEKIAEHPGDSTFWSMA